MRVYLAIPTMDIDRYKAAARSYKEKTPLDLTLLVHHNGPWKVPKNVPNWIDHLTASSKNIGVTAGLHSLYEMALAIGAKDEDFILFSHDDVEMLEWGWLEKVEQWLAERPNCALFGFGGARGLGDPDLYQKPYQLQQLARRDFISNLKSAEQHGRRVLVPTRVATLDLFTIGARVSFLKEIGGWAWWPHVHHSLDNALCLEAARRKYETWMFPVYCEHFGGRTSTRTDFQKDFGKTEGEIHSEGHVTLYENYRDVLPLMVSE